MVKPSWVLILGYGTLGSLVGRSLRQASVPVIGVRRSGADEPALCLTGDISEGATWLRIGERAAELSLPWPAPAVLLCANPGLRRGRDNRLAQGIELLNRALPASRLVYTGSTAVYADAAGGVVDEQGAVDGADPARSGLLAIESAVLTHGGALVLRAPALVGPNRIHALERLRAGSMVVSGDLDRPFSFLHEQDLADICVDALLGGLGSGILNAASPQRIRIRDYYQELATRAGVAMPSGDGRKVASREISAARLWQRYPDRRWRGLDDR